MSTHSSAAEVTKINHEIESSEKNIFGFWVYIMTDCVLFASLFATYAVLRKSTNGGPEGSEIFSLPFVLTETIILLTSSLTCGLAILSARNKNKSATLAWLFVTFILGMTFLTLELSEFRLLINEGNSWTASAFLSSYFTLVGTHGLHIFIGLSWLAAMIIGIVNRNLSSINIRKLILFGMFWHFLDIVWIFIFTIVYLMGVL